MLLYALLVSTSFPVGAVITDGLDPVILTFCRFAIAASVFLAVLGLRREISPPGLSLLLRTAPIGCIMAVFFVSMFEALRWTDALSTGALFTLVPLLAAGFGFAINGQRFNGRHIAFLLVGAAGAVWVIFDGDIDKILTLSLGRGEIVFAGGCLVFSLYSPTIKRLHRGESMFVFTFWIMVSGAVLLGIYGAPRIAALNFGDVPATVWLGILYLAVCSTAISFFLSSSASIVLPAFKVMSYTYLTPVFVVLLEALIWQRWPVPSVVVGVAVIMSVTCCLQFLGEGDNRRRPK